MAAEGDAEALLALGELHMRGNPLAGVHQDVGLAAQYFERAAAAGYPEALYYHGVLLQAGNATGARLQFEAAANVRVGCLRPVQTDA